MLQRMESNGKLPCILFLVQSFMAENKNRMGLSPRQALNGQRLLRISGSAIKIATWNVKTLYQAGKVHNLIQEMKRLEIGIMGVSEMRWPDSGQCDIEDHQVLYSGTSTGAHQHGVGIILKKSLAKYVTNFVPVSERIMLVQMSCTPIPLNIIQVYAPTADSTDVDLEIFYEELSRTYNKLKKNEMTVIMGDFNAKIGKGKVGESIGPFGLGERNERGDRLGVFAAEENLVILNTFFKLPPRRLYTWRSPMDKPEHIVRNQIDYILVNKRFQNSFVSVKTYPGADIMSDHNPVVGVVKVRLKHIKRKKTQIKYDLKKLKDPVVRTIVTEELSKYTQETKPSEDLDVKTQIDNFKSRIEEISRTYLKSDKNVKKKSWMTDEILHLMNKRRKVKNKNDREYENIHRQIQNKIREAKQRKLNEDCDEIEALQKKYDSFNMHKKIKQTAGAYKIKKASRLVDTQGNVVIDKHEKIKVWEDYITKLFNDSRPEPPHINNDEGPLITTAEVGEVVRQMKVGKAPGPDNLHSEFLKLLDDQGLKHIAAIYNKIYQTGKIPQEWLRSEFIALPKKPGARACNDYRTISLMSQLLKVFLKVIHKRIYKVCEEYMSETQFGFRDALGTREAVFAVQVLVQRCRDVGRDVYVCFIDFSKAFDRVQHDKLMHILRNMGLDGRDLRIISQLYWGQSAFINIDGEQSRDIEILRGVRQGCVLSPMLFNVYSEHIFKKALENSDKGILVNGQLLNNVRYADDTIIIAGSLEDLQELMIQVANTSAEYGLDLNAKKTKYMVISKNPTPNRCLHVSQHKIERVQKYTYLGTQLSDQWDHSLEIKCRIEKARAVFQRMSSIFKSHSITLTTKIRVLKCYVFSVLLYGVEAWTLTEATTKKLTAFEMWLYRRILRISWMDHVTNDEVLRRMNKTTEIMTTVKARKLEYLGHIMRNEQRYGLLQRILQGKIPGRRGPGRRRISWLKNLRAWFSMTTTGLFRAAVNKVMIAGMIANIRNG